MASKSVVVSLAKTFHESIDVDENCSSTEFESSLYSKCRYLGNIVDDIPTFIYDNCKRMCNTIVVICFYSHGTIKSILTTFEAMGHLLWIVPFMSQRGMETENDKGTENENIEHAPWLLETLRSYCRLLEYLMNSS